jgi:hypothetical protein
MRLCQFAALVLVLATADAATAQREIQVSPDQKQVLIVKDIAGQHWTITRHLEDETITAMVSSLEAGSTTFLWCLRGDQAGDQVMLSCSVAASCTNACVPEQWSSIAEVTVPTSFLEPPGAIAPIATTCRLIPGDVSDPNNPHGSYLSIEEANSGVNLEALSGSYVVNPAVGPTGVGSAFRVRRFDFGPISGTNGEIIQTGGPGGRLIFFLELPDQTVVAGHLEAILATAEIATGSQSPTLPCVPEIVLDIPFLGGIELMFLATEPEQPGS